NSNTNLNLCVLYICIQVICSLCHTEQDVLSFVPSRFRFNKTASNVGFAWGSIIAQNANFLTMMFRRINTIVINVESAELEAMRTFSIVINVVVRYSRLIKDSHICIEKAMHHNCPVCFEYLFETTKDSLALWAHYTLAMREGDGTTFTVWILCNDFGETSVVNFHIVAHSKHEGRPGMLFIDYYLLIHL
ncbi:hypothetical protein HYC85_009334, partial [Camellia sinensis]